MFVRVRLLFGDRKNVLMVPEQAVFIPLFTMFADWGMHNTHSALVAPRVAVPIGVFLMTQFFRAVPRELEEAAELDHASHFTIFWRIMLPLSVPALTTLGLFTFIFAWNDFLWPLVSAQFVLVASSAIALEAGLSFLGLGDPTQKSWGSMLYYAQARHAFLSGSWPWWVVPPGLMITASVLSFAFLAFGHREVRRTSS